MANLNNVDNRSVMAPNQGKYRGLDDAMPILFLTSLSGPILRNFQYCTLDLKKH